jgi:hypothetical protein
MKALNRQQRKGAILKFVILYVITVILILIPFVFLADFPDQQNEELSDQLKTCRSDLSICAKQTKTPVKWDKRLSELQIQYVKIQEEMDTTVRGMFSTLGTDEGDWTMELITYFYKKVDDLDYLQKRLKVENENLKDILPE